VQWRDIHRSTVCVTPPAVEPLSLTEAKLHLQVDVTADDALIYALRLAAREQVEADTNRSLISTVWDLWFDRFPDGRAIELSRSPVSAIASVTSYDDDDVAVVLSASDYLADLKSEPGRVVLVDGASWPTDLRPANAGVVRFTAGYTSGTAQSVSSITRASTTATATTSAAHGYVTGQRVTLAGADQADYNGTWSIVVTGTTTFTFTVENSPTTPATGTMTATYLGLPERYFQAMKLWMSHLYRPNAKHDDLVRRVYDALVTGGVYALG